jgi:hypothetical protein
LALANFLANEGVSYEDFGKALEAYLSNDLRAWETKWFDTIAGQIVWKIDNAIEDAAAVARSYGMERAFCIAPTASCSYRYLDKKGFTTTPEIAPPIARAVDRDSGTFGVESFDYGNVEIAEEVGWDNYSRAVNGLVSLYQETGLFHGYSFNSWSDVVVYDRAFLQNWLDSSQTSLYYSLQVLSDTQRKDDAYAALDDSFKSMFGLDDSEVIEETVACDIEAAFCAACAE